MDFDPVTDRLRVVSDADQNLSLNPSDGTSAGAGGALAFAPGDPNAGQDPNVAGAAHSNNVAGASSTTLFGIDFILDALVRQNPATGELTTIGGLGVNPGSKLGFDIAAGSGGTAYFVAGFPSGSFFHTIDLTTGVATAAGDIPVADLDGLAAVPPPRYPTVAPGPSPTPDLLGCRPTTTPRNLIVLTSADDTTTGTALGDLVFAGAGDDVVDGVGGDDCIDLATGSDRGRGGQGSDFLPGGSGNDRLLGNTGNDRLTGQGGRDRLSGGRGRDRLIGGSGRDRIFGGPRRDRLVGGSGGDRIAGNTGRDRVVGGPGRDRLSGGPGNDRISGGAGNDRISARDGRRDRVNCGGGRDRVVADAVDRLAPNCE
jgi:Ca2+-binding RTX toxin-like protein